MMRRPPRSTLLTHSFPTRRSSDLSHFLDNGALKQGIRTTAQLFQIEQACGKKRCACSKADIPFFPDRSHTSHAGKNHSSYPGFQLTQCLSDRRCDMGGRYFQHFLINRAHTRSEEHTSELQSLMRNSYAVFCLKK